MVILAIQSTTGRWGYCREDFRQLLRLEYDDEAPFATAAEAIAAAKADTSIPKGAKFRIA